MYLTKGVTSTMEARLLNMLNGAVGIGNGHAVKTVIARLGEMGRDIRGHSEFLLSSIQVFFSYLYIFFALPDRVYCCVFFYPGRTS